MVQPPDITGHSEPPAWPSLKEWGEKHSEKKKGKQRRVQRSQHILKVIDFYHWCFASLPQSVARPTPPGGLGGTWRRQKALIPGCCSSASHSALSLREKQSFAVNLVTPHTLLSTKAASRNNITGAQWTKIITFLPFSHTVRISWDQNLDSLIMWSHPSISLLPTPRYAYRQPMR